MNDWSLSVAVDWFRERLTKPLPGLEAHGKMFPAIKRMPRVIPETAIPSAVMAMLFLRDGEWYLLVMRRIEDGKAHSGQISFPGGRYESDDREVLQTALRETYEEVGIDSGLITVAGALTPLYVVVSNYHVFPFLGFLEERHSYLISQDEVHEVLEVPISELFHPSAKVVAEVVSPAVPDVVRMVNAYRLNNGTIIWGATAMMIAELEIIFNEFRNGR